MKTIIRDYPTGAIALLLLACVKFQYQSYGWRVGFPGLAGGIAVLAIIAIVLLFRIFNAAQDACIARGLLHSRIRCKYDVLIPIGILAVAIHARWYGPTVENEMGKPVLQWEFVWSDEQWAVPFIGALVGVVLLLRVFYLFRAITQDCNEQS